MTKKRETPYIIYDAIHQVMEFPSHFKALLVDLVNLPAMQRLRRIKQLALSDLIFPTASHTRFCHALGTSFLAFRIVREIKRQGFLEEFDELSEKILLSAALLHDIGHGPFSHTFESFFKTLGISVHHEDWTSKILNSDDFVEVFRKHGLDNHISLITDLITKKGKKRQDALKAWKPHWLLASDIIASQLDADRLDYLLRDSHFAGVTYGTFDLNWLISCFTAVETNGSLRLGLTSQGLGSIEHFLIARRLMYQNIYCYPKIVAFEAMLIQFLKELSSLTVKYESLFLPLIGPSLNRFLKEISPRKDNTSIIDAAFSSYILLSDDDIWISLRNLSLNLPQEPPFEKLLLLSEKLNRHETPKIFKVQDKNFTLIKLPTLRKKLGLINEENFWKCNLMEVSFSLYSTFEDPILVSDKEGNASLLNSCSKLIETLGDKIEPSYYLTLDPSLFHQYPKEINQIIAEITNNDQK